MPQSHQTEATVLFVDDETIMVEAYVHSLDDSYSGIPATSGQEALDSIDETVDVVFLDRRMPNMSGDEVLNTLRDRGYEIPVAMMTAVDPDTDIVDMQFDDYVTKPIDKSLLNSTIETLQTVGELDSTVRELYGLASKRTALETTGVHNNQDEDEYDELVERMEALKTETDQQLDEYLDMFPGTEEWFE
jgi:CheY-like chemotaxis protein